MNLVSFRDACIGRRVLAVVLTIEDFHQLERAYEAQGSQKFRTHYLGAPVLHTEFRQSYLLEDGPKGPLIHMIP